MKQYVTYVQDTCRVLSVDGLLADVVSFDLRRPRPALRQVVRVEDAEKFIRKRCSIASMETVLVPKAKLQIVLSDVERLVSHFEDLVEDQDQIAEQRLQDIKSGKVKGRSEEELNTYLKARGVKVA